MGRRVTADEERPRPNHHHWHSAVQGAVASPRLSVSPVRLCDVPLLLLILHPAGHKAMRSAAKDLGYAVGGLIGGLVGLDGGGGGGGAGWPGMGPMPGMPYGVGPWGAPMWVPQPVVPVIPMLCPMCGGLPHMGPCGCGW